MVPRACHLPPLRPLSIACNPRAPPVSISVVACRCLHSGDAIAVTVPSSCSVVLSCCALPCLLAVPCLFLLIYRGISMVQMCKWRKTGVRRV